MFKKILDYLHFFKALYLLAHNKQIFCSWEDKTPFDFSFEQLTVNQNYFFDSLPQKLEKLVHGLDQKSYDVIWMHIVASVRYQTMRRSPFFFDLYNFYDKENREMIKRSPLLPEMEAKKLHIPAEIFTWEYSSVYFHHSLKFAPKSILDYIEGKIFIDAGAYHGDSSLILSRYKPSKIYAFEISKYNIQVMEDILSKSSVPDNLVSIIPMGLGNSEEELTIDDTQNNSCSLLLKDSKSQASNIQIKTTTLDSFSRGLSGKIGFIKADIEGFGFEMAKGMTEILKRDRPVLYLSLYHNVDEFWEIKPFIESLNLNYHFEIRHHSVNWLSEIMLIGCPSELLQKDQLLNP